MTTATRQPETRPDPTSADTAFFEVARRGIDDIVAANRDRCRHVLVASMPKSASTWLDALLVEATGFQRYLLNTTGHDAERVILRGALPMFLARDTVSQEHLRATPGDVALLSWMRIRPVVLVRDLFDVIISAADHGVSEGRRGPAAHVPPAYASWSRRERLWFGVRMMTPWLLSIVTSWQDAEATLPVLWITYEEVTREPAPTVARILRHAGVEVAATRIDAAIASAQRTRPRFNVGTSGRGRSELDPDQVRVVEEIAAAFGPRNLERIGL
ncbi:MAG: sulfotransferase domain-containing protein [Planctomycetes bacterium]|nr:sulfotransferase domain-containing protein [Planctomycetota bacterium]